MTNDPDYNFEAEMAGLYAGGVMGGLFLGALGDILKSEVHTMAWYIAGTVIGAAAGTVAAAVFRRMPQESVEPSP